MPIRFTTERRLAVVIALVALLELWLTLQVREPSTFLVVGPRAFPYALGAAMLLSALLLFVLPPSKREPVDIEPEIVADLHSAEAREGELEWRRLLLLMGLTALYALAFVPAGFVLSSALFIVASARVLGSRQPVRDVIVAIAVTVAIYYLFTRVLRVGLPPLPWLGI